MPLPHTRIALSLILVRVEKCKGEGNRESMRIVFFLHVLFDIIHLSGMKECCFRLQQLYFPGSTLCMPTPVFISDNFCSTVPAFLPPPSEEAKVGQNRLSPSLGLNSPSLLVHRDLFQILKRVIGRAWAGANQPSTAASQQLSARLHELEGWPSSPSDSLHLISPYSCLKKGLICKGKMHGRRGDVRMSLFNAVSDSTPFLAERHCHSQNWVRQWQGIATELPGFSLFDCMWGIKHFGAVRCIKKGGKKANQKPPLLTSSLDILRGRFLLLSRLS